jgi:hypothetical protein
MWNNSPIFKEYPRPEFDLIDQWLKESKNNQL